MANMCEKVAEISDPTHHTSLMTSLRTFINTESFVDVVFICQGGHKVYAHKLMLISVSRLLKKIMAENPHSNEMIVVHLPDVSSKLLRIVFNFLYIGFMRLNSAEMDQFKMVLRLLDIEIFQKNSDQENSANQSSVGGSSSNSSVTGTSAPSEVQYTTTVPPNVVNSASIPVVNRPLQGVSTEYIPIAQPTNVTGDNGPHQYIAIRADQLGIPANSRGEVMISYSAVPIHNNIVVQPNQLGLQSSHQSMIQDQSQYTACTSNVVTNPTHVTTNTVSSNVVPINSIAQSPVNLQHVQPISVQTSGQQLVRLVPAPQNQPVPNNSNLTFANTPGKTSHSISNNPQLNMKGCKRKSPHFEKPSIHRATNNPDEIIDLSDDYDDGINMSNISSTTAKHSRVVNRNASNRGSGGGTKFTTATSTSQLTSALLSKADQRNTSVTQPSQSNTPLVAQPSQSNAASVTQPGGRTQSTATLLRSKRRKGGKVVEVDLEEIKPKVNNDNSSSSANCVSNWMT